jgi:hypothetical protein
LRKMVTVVPRMSASAVSNRSPGAVTFAIASV